MNKYLKYLISLFLAFVLIANDGTLDSQAKSADYYQSSYVILKRELDFKNSRLYVLGRFISRVQASFSIPLPSLEFSDVCSFQIRILLKLRTLLYQHINSFIKQSVFLNELLTSNNLYKSLYSA
ncbi:hypothetical protein DMB65_14320 [Flavobacterium cheongpyeongense]|uniref:Uncharacterized protein n=1 Tax=Flavobacterium cheongpyeongense TaxID=2212651 RepID=A0A2V4C1Z1_9FLAO|nr:hypothetical protein [Flavobacterium cheongpyeongense]PXY40234.1 hypothetical protein DMB65_14320 [Flavobacterium cheongpyeongense]